LKVALNTINLFF